MTILLSFIFFICYTFYYCKNMYLFKLLKKVFKKIISLQDNIVTASGLSSSFFGEVVKFKTFYSRLIGQIFNLKKSLVRIATILGFKTSSKLRNFINGIFKNAKAQQVEIVNSNISKISYYFPNTFTIHYSSDKISYYTTYLCEFDKYYRNISIRDIMRGKYKKENELVIIDNSNQLLFFSDLPIHVEFFDELNLNKNEEKFKFFYVNLKTYDYEYVGKEDILNRTYSLKENRFNQFLTRFAINNKIYFYNLYRTISKSRERLEQYIISEWHICVDVKYSYLFEEKLNEFKKEMNIVILNDAKGEYFFKRKYFDCFDWENEYANHELNMFTSFYYDIDLKDYYYLGYHTNKFHGSTSSLRLYVFKDYMNYLADKFGYSENDYFTFFNEKVDSFDIGDDCLNEFIDGYLYLLPEKQEKK